MAGENTNIKKKLDTEVFSILNLLKMDYCYHGFLFASPNTGDLLGSKCALRNLTLIKPLMAVAPNITSPCSFSQ